MQHQQCLRQTKHCLRQREQVSEANCNMPDSIEMQCHEVIHLKRAAEQLQRLEPATTRAAWRGLNATLNDTLDDTLNDTLDDTLDDTLNDDSLNETTTTSV
jgi:uncharacterized lipoprotein YajG